MPLLQHRFPEPALPPMALTSRLQLHTLCSPHTPPHWDMSAPQQQPHITGSALFHLLPPVSCPTSSVPHPISHICTQSLPRGWHAPSPSTAYHIFGKTCSPTALRCCESHLGTVVSGEERVRPVLPHGRRSSWLPARVQRSPPPSGHTILHHCLCRAWLLPHDRHVTLPHATTQMLSHPGVPLVLGTSPSISH